VQAGSVESDKHGDIVSDISWAGSVELEPEVGDWLQGLPPEDFATVETYIDLLAEVGPLLDEPHTRQLSGKLRELRFRLSRRPWRITYFMPGPTRRIRIVMLTVFAKTQRQERRQIARAVAAMTRCVAEGHTAEEDDR
jgi:hypothetical protein